jgi:hypothetical protein
LAATVARYVFSNSSHDPERSLPHVIRMIMARPPVAIAGHYRLSVRRYA